MLTPVLDSAMMQVMERSGPDFFAPEVIEINENVGIDYNALYQHADVKREECGFGAWETGLTEINSGYRSDEDGPSSPVVPDMTFMFPRTPHHSPDPSTPPGPVSDNALESVFLERTSTGGYERTVSGGFERTISGGIAPRQVVQQADEMEADVAVVAAAAAEPDEETSACGRTLRRTCRARRPPSFKRNVDETPRVVHRRPGTLGGGAGKASTAAADAAAKAAAAKAALGGGVRKRPSGSMSVDDRVLAIFGEEALRLDRDAFKTWRAATELPALTSAEQAALKRLRRRLLGRTYAKRSRDRQVAYAEAVEAECDQLREENAMIRSRIEKLQCLLDADARY